MLKPVKRRYLYTNGLVHRISQLTLKSHDDIWIEIESEINKEFNIDLSVELDKAKADYERYYYNQCIGRGGAKNVPKSVKRPSAIKNISLNQIISANFDWYQTATNMLRAMKDVAVKAKQNVSAQDKLNFSKD